jgi:hypothetical protein
MIHQGKDCNDHPCRIRSSGMVCRALEQLGLLQEIDEAHHEGQCLESSFVKITTKPTLHA